jgi:hypothetical protein
VGLGVGVADGLRVLVGGGIGVSVGLRVLVGLGVGVRVGLLVTVGRGVSVLVGLLVIVDRGVSVLVGPSVLVDNGRDVGSDVKIKVISGLWQSGSALSIKWSPSSSLALKQYSLAPVSGINVTGGISQMMIESKRTSASGLSMDSTYKPTSPPA